MRSSRSFVVTMTLLLGLCVPAGGCGGGREGAGAPGDGLVPTGCDPMLGACASRIVSEAQLIGGDLALGQVGDFLLENDRARFIVQRPLSHLALASQFGGNLIDADVRRPAGEPGRDVFGELGFLVNLAGTVAAESVEVEQPGGDGRDAVVVTRGAYDLSGYFILGVAVQTLIGLDPFALRGIDLDRPWPVRFEIRYTLSPGSLALRVELTTHNDGTEPVPLLVAYFVQGGQVNVFVPGVPAFGPGGVDLADTIFFDPVDGEIPVGYGLVPDGRRDRFLLALLGAQALLHKGTLEDLLLFPEHAPDFIPPGGAVTLGAHFVAGGRLDEAVGAAEHLTDPLDCSPFSGVVAEEGSGLPLQGADVTALRMPGSLLLPMAITHDRTDARGRFELCLPPGPAALITGQTGRPYAGGRPEPRPALVDVPVRSEPPATPDVTLTLPATARLRVSATDPAGQPLPARLTVLGRDPSPPDSRLQGDGFDPLAPGVLCMEDSIDGRFDLFVEPGDMDVVVTRGPEYSLFRTPMVLSPGEIRDVAVVLHHVVDTEGFLSGDFHVHSGPGPDSTVSYERRVTNMLAEGVEVLVATDHAFVSDYGPTIRRMGVESQIATIAGQEITTFATGHFGPFPLPRTDLPNGGAINWVGKDPAQLVEEVHRLSPTAVFQIMHPRAMPAPGNISNYFTSIDLSFDAGGPRTGPDALDPADVRLPAEAQWLSPRFNAMEVVTFGNVQGLSDWFNLLNAGWRLTATGNSDTHTRWVEGSGYARNLVRVDAAHEDIAHFDAERFTAAVRAGKNSVTLGPFIDLVLYAADGTREARVGERLEVPVGESVRIDVRVQSPAWLVADRVTLYENGIPIQELRALPSLVTLESGGQRNEFRSSVLHTVSGDAHYVASVTGDQSLYPLLPYNWEAPGRITMDRIRADDLAGTIRPFSVTNPVWVDADGDGRITPSGVIVEQDCQAYRKDDRTNPYVEVPARNCDCVLAGKAPGC